MRPTTNIEYNSIQPYNKSPHFKLYKINNYALSNIFFAGGKLSSIDFPCSFAPLQWLLWRSQKSKRKEKLL